MGEITHGGDYYIGLGDYKCRQGGDYNVGMARLQVYSRHGGDYNVVRG